MCEGGIWEMLTLTDIGGGERVFLADIFCEHLLRNNCGYNIQIDNDQVKTGVVLETVVLRITSGYPNLICYFKLCNR